MSYSLQSILSPTNRPWANNPQSRYKLPAPASNTPLHPTPSNDTHYHSHTPSAFLHPQPFTPYQHPDPTAYSEPDYGSSPPLLSRPQEPLTRHLPAEVSTPSRPVWQPPEHQLASSDDYSSDDFSEFTVSSSFTLGEDDEAPNDYLNQPNDNPDVNFGYGNSFLTTYIDPHPHPPTQIDLTQASPPTMAPSQSRKRSFTQIDLEAGPSTLGSSSTKRRRTPTAHSSTLRSAPQHSKSIEEIDLVADEDGLTATLQKQRAEAVKALQQPAGGKKSKLSSLQCTVCLDTPDDLTATSCGHTFCRSCLMNWLIAGEKEPQRRPNCPACRKPLKRSNKTDTIPLEIMKRSAK